MLCLSMKDYDKILDYAVQNLPLEICGLIGGTVENGIKVVRQVYFLKNTDKSSEHFSMDPLEQLAAVKDLRKKGFMLIGNFHSHPNTPSRPSEEDKKFAFDSKASYLILSLQSMDNPVLKSFRIYNNNICFEEKIIIS